MPSVQVLSSPEKQEIREKLREFSTLDLDPGEDLMGYVYDKEVADKEVRIRFFPTPETAPVEAIYFEVEVYQHADWYDDSIGAYSRENLRNGGPLYEALAEELETIVRDELNTNASFIVPKGSSAFTAEASL